MPRRCHRARSRNVRCDRGIFSPVPESAERGAGDAPQPAGCHRILLFCEAVAKSLKRPPKRRRTG
jgi:hypothetical protein